MQVYRDRVPLPAQPVTLADALRYANQYNIDVWIAEAEKQFHQELATQARLKMLPSILAGTYLAERSELDASSSQSLATGEQTLEPSFSSERQTKTFDIGLTWNMLDFGISYFRARQHSSREIIAAQRAQRVRQNLALSVTRAWWQAVAARESARDAEQITETVAVMIDHLAGEVEDKTISEIEGLSRETFLLEQQEELRRYRRAFLRATTELASLMGLPPGTEIELAEVDLDQAVSASAPDVQALEIEALMRRPELFEKDLEQAITHDEARIAVAEMLPSPAFLWRFNYDDNHFLAFNHWNTVGLQASWDLLSIPLQLKQVEALEVQEDIIAKRRTAIAIAILTQLHLSLIDYGECFRDQEITHEIAEKRERLLAAVSEQVEEGQTHGGELLDHELRYLRARARYLGSLAEFQASRARLLNTVGRTVLDDDRDVTNPASQPAEPTPGSRPAPETDMIGTASR